LALRYAGGMLEAVIFDVDGVLVDSYRPHYRSWRQLASEHGFSLTEEQFTETFGRTSRDIIRRFWAGEAPDDRRIRELDDRKEALYRRIVSEDFPAMDGAVALLEALHAAGVRIAVGSSGPPENVELVLDKLGRRELIGAVVTGMDVTRGKPDPQVFLIAAERLGIPPEACVVVEDAPDGIRAAKAAGMAAVALISTGRTEDAFREVEPDLAVRSLRELSPNRLRSLRA
jgi:beta-phosphoglucomutase